MRIEGSSARRSTSTSGAGATGRPGPVRAHPARTTPTSSQGRARAAGILALSLLARAPLLWKPLTPCQDAAVSPTALVVLLWLGFAGTHLVLSSLPVRQRIVARLGEGPFRGLYSLVAFAFFVPLVRTFFAHKHAGRWLWLVERGTGLRGAGFRAFYEATPFLPFTGRDTLRGLRELSPVVVVAGIAATAVVRYYHAAWFGG